MGQIKFIGGIILLAVFVVAIITFVTNFGIDNNAYTRLSNDSDFETVRSAAHNNITLFRNDTSEASTSFTQSTVEDDSDTLKSPSVFQTSRTTRQTISLVLGLIREKVFGGDSRFNIVLLAISSFVVFLAVVLAWKTFRGNPE